MHWAKVKANGHVSAIPLIIQLIQYPSASIYMYMYIWSVHSLGSRPSLRAFTLHADCVWEGKIEKLGKAWAQVSCEVDVR